jgi:pyruvate/2-oxoglutarate dehydrogenase complex dihydrolipoamide acyltransferase (E2) component/uncharacterized OsmC-like protein
MSVDIVMPQLGQAMVTGVVVAWHVPDGKQVKAGAPLLTIESDKSAFEIEAAATGVVHQQIGPGMEAEVGAILGTITVAGAGDPDPAGAPSVRLPAPTATAAEPRDRVRTATVVASPRARERAAAAKISLEEITPSGAGGMVTAHDVERALAARATGSSTPSGANFCRPISASQKSAIRRLQASWQQAPHIVQMIEIDATGLVAAQDAIRAGQLDASLNDIVLQAAADTMAEYPDLNVHIDGETIVANERVSISIAVATERGLRTPVINAVDGRSLAEVAALSRAAIEAARQGRAVAGRASLTVSNLGRYGIRCGTPVLNLDESVLVFVGEIVNRPAVVDSAIVARPQLILSIAYDHRIVDGLRAAEFSAALRRRLESFVPPHNPQAKQAPATRAAHLSCSAGLRCDLTDGRHHWTVDEPLTIGGQDSGADPVTLVLSGLLSCMTIALRITAERRKVTIERIAGSIETQPRGAVKSIRAKIEVWSSAPVEEVNALLKPAKTSCYVHEMLRPDLDVAIELLAHKIK